MTNNSTPFLDCICSIYFKRRRREMWSYNIQIESQLYPEESILLSCTEINVSDPVWNQTLNRKVSSIIFKANKKYLSKFIKDEKKSKINLINQVSYCHKNQDKKNLCLLHVNSIKSKWFGSCVLFKLLCFESPYSIIFNQHQHCINRISKMKRLWGCLPSQG